MSARVTAAVVARVLTQLRRDPRTVLMLLALPALLVTLLWWVYDRSDATLAAVGPPLVAVFPFLVMFLVSSVTTLRERTSGTLERLLTMPAGRLDLLVGYAVAFGLVAVLQSGVVVGVTVGLLGLDPVGSLGLFVLVAVLGAVLGTALGLFVSAFARSEFQAVQFMPAVVVPQVLLCGLLVPRDGLPAVLGPVSDVLPLSYAVDAVQRVNASTATGEVWTDLAVMLGWIAALLGLGALTLRRRTG